MSADSNCKFPRGNAVKTAGPDMRAGNEVPQEGALTDKLKARRIATAGSLLWIIMPTFKKLMQEGDVRISQQYKPTDPISPAFIEDLTKIVSFTYEQLQNSIGQLYRLAQQHEKVKTLYNELEEMMMVSYDEGIINSASVQDALSAGAGSFKSTAMDMVRTLTEQNRSMTIEQFLEEMALPLPPRELAKNLPPQAVDATRTALRRDSQGNWHEGYAPGNIIQKEDGRLSLKTDELQTLRDVNNFSTLDGIASQTIFGCIIFIPQSFAKSVDIDLEAILQRVGGNVSLLENQVYEVLFGQIAQAARERLLAPIPSEAHAKARRA